jgi:hypothetical protein
VCVQQYQVEYRQAVKYTTDCIRCKGAIIDYMFLPFFIRPSSGLAWLSKEELVQLYKLQKYIIWVKIRGVWKTRSRFVGEGGGGVHKLLDSE